MENRNWNLLYYMRLYHIPFSEGECGRPWAHTRSLADTLSRTLDAFLMLSLLSYFIKFHCSHFCSLTNLRTMSMEIEELAMYTSCVKVP